MLTEGEVRSTAGGARAHAADANTPAVPWSFNCRCLRWSAKDSTWCAKWDLNWKLTPLRQLQVQWDGVAHCACVCACTQMPRCAMLWRSEETSGVGFLPSLHCVWVLEMELRLSGWCGKCFYLASSGVTQDHCKSAFTTLLHRTMGGVWAAMTGIQLGFCNYIHTLSKLLCILYSGDICYG